MLNEEGLAAEFCTRTAAALGDLPFEIVVVDDGSSDGTAAILDEQADADPRIRVLHLSRPFGHQMALTAGLDHARGDAVVMIDGDLQDPPELIPELVARWRERRRHRRRQAPRARGRDALQARHRALVLRAHGPARPGRARAQRRRLPPLRPRAARRAAADARALALPARDELVGRLPARRRRVRPRRARRRRDEVPDRAHAALRARRRDVVLELPAPARGARRRRSARSSRCSACR